MLNHHLSMLVLPYTYTIKAKSINLTWSNAGLQSSSPTERETHLVLVTCYNTCTGSLEDRCKDAQLVMRYKITNKNALRLLNKIDLSHYWDNQGKCTTCNHPSFSQQRQDEEWFFPCAISAWNRLLSPIVLSGSFETFKAAISSIKLTNTKKSNL